MKILTNEEKTILLRIAREAIWAVANEKKPERLTPEDFSSNLQLEAASFVTLTKNGSLRGCIGSLEASQPFVLDVQEHAIAAAFEDFRFPNMQKEEVDDIEIEISRLSPISPLNYA